MTEARQINEEAIERERIKILRLQREYNQRINPQGEVLKRAPRFVDESGIATALEVGPAVVGEKIGMGGGPVGMRVGGAGGAAVGRGLANQARRIEDFIQSEAVPEGTFGERFLAGVTGQARSMGEAAVEDLAFGTAFHGLGKVRAPIKSALRFAGGLKRPTGLGVLGFRKRTGPLGFTGEPAPISMEVTEAIEDASRVDIPLTAKDLDKAFVRGFAKVLGIMPIIGGPIREAEVLAKGRISKALATTLDGISPAINLPALGVKLDKAARGAAKARRTIAGAKYETMRRNFAALRDPETLADPEVIPTQTIKDQVLEILGSVELLPKTKFGKPVGFAPSVDDTFNEALIRFADLPEFISHPQLEALQKNLNRAARSRTGKDMAADEFRIITDINASTWDAMQSIPREAGIGDEVMDSIRTAKKSWANLKALEETAAARLFKRVDRNYWGAGFNKPSTALTDEIADLFISNPSTMRSPEFIGQMDALMKPENRRAVGRAVVERAATPTREVSGGLAVFDPFEMEAKLGLSAPEEALGEASRKRNKQTLARLLEGGETTVDGIISLLNTAKRIGGAPAGDPSTFLTRRIILGGGLIGGAALVGGGGAAEGPAGAGIGLFTLGALVLGGRHVSRLLSTKEGLRVLRDGLEPNLTRQQIVLLADRIRRALPDEPIEIEGQ